MEKKPGLPVWLFLEDPDTATSCRGVQHPPRILSTLGISYPGSVPASGPCHASCHPLPHLCRACALTGSALPFYFHQFWFSFQVLTQFLPLPWSTPGPCHRPLPSSSLGLRSSPLLPCSGRAIHLPAGTLTCLSVCVYVCARARVCLSLCV